MKHLRAHIIPPANRPLELLAELHAIMGHSPFLFPSRTAIDGHISENTAGKIINGMGYKGMATPHGFRSLASSVLNEQGYNPDAIERQLAHVEQNKVRAAYHHTEYLLQRVEMMQWYFRLFAICANGIIKPTLWLRVKQNEPRYTLF
ncbi:phage integrase family protein [Neisseria musculi]|uniref:Phage integrase family protein n=2 Tax=Neisseriaceae TaxID=481 RepID=A0A7H1MFE5_9NEIS|nr:phage integrase family protein [Neisseria musculi]